MLTMLTVLHILNPGFPQSGGGGSTSSVTVTYNLYELAEPLTFEIVSGGTLYWKADNANSTKTIEYNLNGGGWIAVTASKDDNDGLGATICSVNSGDTVQFRGQNEAYGVHGSTNYFQHSTDCLFYAYGNMMSLINYENFRTNNVFERFGANFRYMFYNNTGLLSHPKKLLHLPVRELKSQSYQFMFYGCTNLERTPYFVIDKTDSTCCGQMFYGCTNLKKCIGRLNADTLSISCYNGMFQGCASLESAPELPATTLASGCYGRMFQGCTSLKKAPELSAMTMKDGCYASMFADCIGLTKPPKLPATTLAYNCYGVDFPYNPNTGMFGRCVNLETAPELPATTLAQACYKGMFQGCTSLTTAPELPATTLAKECYLNLFYECSNLVNVPSILPVTTLAESCYNGMFNRCSNLTKAPELPATTLVNGCYQSMFRECNKLNYIKCLATDIPATSCTYQWAWSWGSKATSGTFIKNKDIDENTWGRGISGIPIGWTVQDA